MHELVSADRRCPGHRRATGLSVASALDAGVARQPLDGALRDSSAFVFELVPDLELAVGAVGTDMHMEHGSFADGHE